MPQPTNPPRFLHVSLRELLLLVAFCAVGCAALKTAGNLWWTVLSAFTLLVVMGFALVAAIDRGPRQAFAQGFVIWVLIYSVLFFAQPSDASNLPISRELDPYTGRLPTTRLMLPLFKAMVTGRYVDLVTGQEVPNYDPNRPAAGGTSGFGGGGLNGVSYEESPTREDFLSIGHLLWTLLLGYVGGHIARVIYLRRIARDQGPDGSAAAT
jgi:hypothetical protein